MENETLTEPPPEQDVLFVVNVIVLPVLLVIGFINQSINFLTLQYLKSPTFIFLEATTVADLLNIFFNVFFVIDNIGGIDYRDSFVISAYYTFCSLHLMRWLDAVSGHCLIALTIDRCLSLWRPLVFSRLVEEGRGTRILISLLIFVVSFLIQAPSALDSMLLEDSFDGTSHFEPYYNSDVMDSDWFHAFQIFRDIYQRWLPLGLIIFLNAAMSIKIFALQSNRKGTVSGSSAPNHWRLSALLLVTAASFVLCRLPSAINNLIEVLFGIVDITALTAISNITLSLSYVLNFYLYALCSAEYRTALGKLFRSYFPVALARLFGVRSPKTTMSHISNHPRPSMASAIPTSRPRAASSVY